MWCPVADNDPESSPGTAPFVPDFDTGAHSQALESPAADHGPTADELLAPVDSSRNDLPRLSATPAWHGNGTAGDVQPHQPQPIAPDAAPPPAQSVTVPSRYYYLKWWKLVLVIVGVWIVAAPIGLALFYWWYHSLNKTPAVFAVLLYAVVCTVGSLMLAMIPGRPLLAALAIAVMSAVFASVVAAAPLYGHYYCLRTKHCVAGIIPY